LKGLDSRLRGNDRKRHFPTFYERVNFALSNNFWGLAGFLIIIKTSDARRIDGARHKAQGARLR
jgi:hypothetical protein